MLEGVAVRVSVRGWVDTEAMQLLINTLFRKKIIRAKGSLDLQCILAKIREQ